MKVRKTPIRMCVSCRETSDKRKLIRVVRDARGGVSMDPSGRVSGRGAYLCGAKECIGQALKGKKLARALRCEIPSELIRELESRLLSFDHGSDQTSCRDECNES